MKKITIKESGMVFGEFSPEQLFHIEESEIYKKLQQGLRMGEFVVHNNNVLYVIEAKSSFPNPVSQSGRGQFSRSVREVSEKLINAFCLTASLAIKRHEDSTEEASVAIRESITSGGNIVLCLIIKDHKREWLIGVKEKLQKNLKRIGKICNVEIIAINDDQARGKKLVV